MDLGVAGKVAIVTGSGRGLGAAVARALVAEGVHVLVNDVDGTEAEAVAAELESLSDGRANVALKVGDVGRWEDARAIVDEATGVLGGADILVNNAGIWRDAVVHKMDLDLWHEVIRVNLTGTFFMTKAAYPTMREQKWGRIVNFTSQAGLGGNFGQANYSAAKAGIIGLTKSNAKEFARHNITVNAVAPAAQGTRAVGTMADELRNTFAQTNPMGRIGEPEETATAVAFLVSEGARYITGQVLGVDGGFSMGRP